MNEHLYDMSNVVITGMNGETIGTFDENTETFCPDEARLRTIIHQAYDEALEEVKKEYPYADAKYLIDQLDDLFRAKCRKRISDDGEYDAVIRYWEHVLNETVYAD